MGGGKWLRLIFGLALLSLSYVHLCQHFGCIFPSTRLVKGPLYAENSVSPCSLLTLQGIYIQQICIKKEKKKEYC